MKPDEKETKVVLQILKNHRPVTSVYIGEKLTAIVESDVDRKRRLTVVMNSSYSRTPARHELQRHARRRSRAHAQLHPADPRRVSSRRLGRDAEQVLADAAGDGQHDGGAARAGGALHRLPHRRLRPDRHRVQRDRVPGQVRGAGGSGGSAEPRQGTACGARARRAAAPRPADGDKVTVDQRLRVLVVDGPAERDSLLWSLESGPAAFCVQPAFWMSLMALCSLSLVGLAVCASLMLRRHTSYGAPR